MAGSWLPTPEHEAIWDQTIALFEQSVRGIPTEQDTLRLIANNPLHRIYSKTRRVTPDRSAHE